MLPVAQEVYVEVKLLLSFHSDYLKTKPLGVEVKRGKGLDDDQVGLMCGLRLLISGSAQDTAAVVESQGQGAGWTGDCI